MPVRPPSRAALPTPVGSLAVDAAPEGKHPVGRLVDGPVGRTLASQAAPMFAGILANVGFQVIEAWFIGRLGPAALAALAFCMPVAMSVISVAIGLSAGTSVAVARAFGAGDAPAARRLATDAVLLTFVVIATLGVATAAASGPLFGVLGAGPELLPLIEGYLSIWLPGVVLFLVPMVGLGAVRAAGNTRFQGGAMIAAVAVNALLDPLLIFGAGPIPALGLRGAALGNVAAWMLLCTAALWKMRQEGLLETTALPRWKVFRASTRSILHVGLPAAASNAIIPLSTALIVGILAGFGPEAVAGLGVATRIEGLAMIAFLGLSAVVNPFFAANAGARRRDRLQEALRLLRRFALWFGFAAAALLWLAAPWLADRFTDDPHVAAVAASYLRLVPLSYGAAGLIMTSNAAFNGLGLPLAAMAISALRMFALNVPIAWLGARWFGVPGVFLGIATANLVVGTIAVRWIRRLTQTAS